MTYFRDVAYVEAIVYGVVLEMGKGELILLAELKKNWRKHIRKSVEKRVRKIVKGKECVNRKKEERERDQKKKEREKKNNEPSWYRTIES